MRPPSPASTPAQRRAVEYGIAPGELAHGPLLVIAGAGSGKTLTLAARVARLVLAGADPARILLLTFSRRAAAEMERRVGRVLHEALGLAPARGAPRLAWCGTFHAIGARLLRAHAAALGLDPSFTVDDRSDSEDLIHVLRQRLGLAGSRAPLSAEGDLPGDLLAGRQLAGEPGRGAAQRLSLVRRRARRAASGCSPPTPPRSRRSACSTSTTCSSGGRRRSPSRRSRAAMAARFDHVLVDEYQDTNRLQAAILLGLKPDGRGLTVVGDDAQSIYSFRAAEVRNILDFAGRFAPPAEVVTLERNYRSTAPLLAASNAVIALAAERHAKELWSDRPAVEPPAIVWVADESEQAAWVAERDPRAARDRASR